MTYEDAIAFWYGRVNFEVKSATPADLKLERMTDLLRRLGNPHTQYPCVHITGTKGKGSTAAMVDAILQAAGKRTGLFTSPHLSHVEERIRVCGQPIPQDALAKCMAEIVPAVQGVEEEFKVPVTFFEIGTALGFLYFAQQKIDVAVVEVGLGGRFDSTNVITPVVSVITSIGLDHMAQLGGTLEEIAYQKAGIIKPKVPVVSGVTQPGPRDVIEQVAKFASSPVDRLGREFWYAPDLAVVVPKQTRIITPTIAAPGEPDDRIARKQRIILNSDARTWEPMHVGLLGQHQMANAAIAVAVVQRLMEQGMDVPDEAVTKGLAEVQWPARIEVIRTQPTVILDCAHNLPSIEALIATIEDSIPVMGGKRLVFAVSQDKTWVPMLQALARMFGYFYLTKYGNNPRCVQPHLLEEMVKNIVPNANVQTFAHASDAWAAARADAGPEDLIVVTGSVFLAGELRPTVLAEAKANG